MAKRKRQVVKTKRPPAKPDKDFAGLTRRLLLFANIGVPRDLYLRMLSKLLLEGAACDVLEIRTTDGDLSYLWRAEVRSEGGLRFGMKYYHRDEGYESLLDAGGDPALAEIRRRVFERRPVPASPNFTGNGSFWTIDAAKPAVLGGDGEEALALRDRPRQPGAIGAGERPRRPFQRQRHRVFRRRRPGHRDNDSRPARAAGFTRPG